MDTKEKSRTATGQARKKAPAPSKSKTAGKSSTAPENSKTSGKNRTAPGKSAASGKRRPVKSKASAPIYTRKRPRPKRKKSRTPSLEVVYTQPDPFNRNRFLLRLLTVVAVVMALFFGMSIFFKVETVMVSGADKYTPWEIRQASGIEEGENLLALNEAMIGGKIKTALPYVSRVRVGIKLPDTVNIEIEEIAVAYAVESVRNGWWLMTADGQVMESVISADAEDYTKILGIRLESPIAGGQAVASEPDHSQQATGESGAEQESTEGTEPVVVYAADQLAVALDIVQYLEDNGILGKTDRVNVSDMGQLELWYGDQYQVLLGDSTRLSYKIEMMKNTIDQLGEHYSGVLDVSYTLRPEEVVYTPFS